MTGRQNDAARTAFPNEVRRRWRGQQSIATDNRAHHTIRRGDAKDDLNGFAVEIPPVTTDNECVFRFQGSNVEHCLHKVFQIVRRLKHFGALAQSGRPGTLIGERRCWNSAHGGHVLSVVVVDK